MIYGNLLPVALLICNQVAADVSPTNLTPREVVESWKDREGKVLTAQLSWKVKYTYTPKGLIELRPPHLKELSPTEVPLHDVALSYPSQLLLDGIRMRYS